MLLVGWLWAWPLLAKAQQGNPLLSGSVTKIDSLRRALTEDIAREQRLRIYNQLSEAYLMNRPDSALFFARKGYKATRGEQQLQLRASFAHNIGNALMQSGQPRESLAYLQEAQQYYTAENQLEDQSAVQHSLGTAYYYLGQLNNSYEAFTKFALLARRLNDSLKLYDANYMLGSLLIGQKKYREAVGRLRLAERFLPPEPAPGQAAGLNLNLGTAYSRLSVLDSAEVFYTAALHDFKRANILSGAGLAHYSLGELYQLNLNKPELALQHYDTAMVLSRKTQNQEYLVLSLIGKASVYNERGKYSAAEPLASEALDLARKGGYRIRVQDAYNELRMVYLNMGRYREAYEALDSVRHIEEELRNEEKAEELGQLKARYEYEQQALLRQQTQAATRIVQQRRNRSQTLLLGAVLMSILSLGFFLRRFRKYKRVLQVFVYAAALLFFELILITLDPIIEQYTGRVPYILLGVNGVLAILFSFLHTAIERRYTRQANKPAP